MTKLSAGPIDGPITTSGSTLGLISCCSPGEAHCVMGSVLADWTVSVIAAPSAALKTRAKARRNQLEDIVTLNIVLQLQSLSTNDGRPVAFPHRLVHVDPNPAVAEVDCILVLGVGNPFDHRLFANTETHTDRAGHHYITRNDIALVGEIHHSHGPSVFRGHGR